MITSLVIPIFWSFAALWSTYKVFSDIPRLRTQAGWETVMDILWIVLGFALAIYHWVMYVKSKKKAAEKEEER